MDTSRVLLDSNIYDFHHQIQPLQCCFAMSITWDAPVSDPMRRNLLNSFRSCRNGSSIFLPSFPHVPQHFFHYSDSPCFNSSNAVLIPFPSTRDVVCLLRQCFFLLDPPASHLSRCHFFQTHEHLLLPTVHQPGSPGAFFYAHTNFRRPFGASFEPLNIHQRCRK